MLPKLVLLSSEKSPRSSMTFLCCLLALLGLPTFYGVAQSQEAERSAEIKAAADKNRDPVADATTEGGPTEKPFARDPDEPSLADLVAQFNELVKAKRYGEAKMIARMARDIDPRDPVVEIMIWKAQYRLGEIKTYSSGGNDGKASGAKAPAVKDVRRPRVATPGIRDAAEEEAERATQRLLKGIKKDDPGIRIPAPVKHIQYTENHPQFSENSTGPDTTSPNRVQGPTELPVSEPARAKIPVTPEMSKLWEQFNFALMEKRFDVAEQIGRKAMQLEPGNRAGELMISKAIFAEKPRPPSPEFLPQPKASPRELEIILKLDQPISFDFDDQPLSAAIRQLEKQLGFNILLDVASIKKHNLGENQVVTLRVRDISLKNALKLILDACELTYLVEHERITVLPKLEADQRLETRIYPVRDLIVEKDDFETLIDAIRAGVQPDSWFNNRRASISKVPASGCLVIFQSPHGHADVLRLLRTLREAKGVPGGGAGIARPPQDVPTAGIGIGGSGGGGGGFY